MKRHLGFLLGLLALGLVLTQSVDAQRTLDRSMTLRAASGALTAGETTTALNVSRHRAAIITLNVTTLTTPDGDDEVDFYIQTTYDGTTWVDVENIHFTTADNGSTPTRIAGISVVTFSSTDTAIAGTDGAIADNTKAQLLLGESVRIKTAVAGATAPTYAYNATIYLVPLN